MAKKYFSLKKFKENSPYKKIDEKYWKYLDGQEVEVIMIPRYIVTDKNGEKREISDKWLEEKE